MKVYVKNTHLLGSFVRFVDRDEYLYNVAKSLLISSNTHANVDTTGLKLRGDEFERKNALLMGLQHILQSNKIKADFLRHLQKNLSLEKLNQRFYNAKFLLNKIKDNDSGRALYALSALQQSLKHDFMLRDTEEIENVMSITMDPSNHCYINNNLKEKLIENYQDTPEFYEKYERIFGVKYNREKNENEENELFTFQTAARSSLSTVAGLLDQEMKFEHCASYFPTFQPKSLDCEVWKANYLKNKNMARSIFSNS